MIMIKVFLASLVACGNQVFDLNIVKGPEVAGTYKECILQARSIIDAFRDPDNKENIIEVLQSFVGDEFEFLLERIKKKEFLREMFFIVREQKIEEEFFTVFDEIYLRGFGHYPMQEFLYDFMKSVLCMSETNKRVMDLKNEYFTHVSNFTEFMFDAIELKPIMLVKDKRYSSDRLVIRRNAPIGSVGAETFDPIKSVDTRTRDLKKYLECTEHFEISLDSIDELLEKSISILSLMLKGKHEIKKNQKMIIEIIKKISFIYAKLELIDKKSKLQTQVMHNMSEFLLLSLPFLEIDFLNSISCSPKEKVGNFFVAACQSYKYYRYKPRLEEFLLKYLEGKDTDAIRKYCKKLVHIFPVHFLANKYMKASLDENVVTLKDLFNLFAKNVSEINEVWSISFFEYLFKRHNIVDDVFWLLADFLSVANLSGMSLSDGQLIHQYVAINYPEHLVKFIRNLTDSLDDDDTNNLIFKLVGLSRLPNFGILLLNKHGIKKLREIELQLFEGSYPEKNFLIFADNDPILMFVELFKRYSIDCQDDLQYEVRSILIEYCIKLLEKYSIFSEKKEFNLFIKLYNQIMFKEESELESYIDKVTEVLDASSIDNVDNSRMIGEWRKGYEEFQSKHRTRYREKPDPKGSKVKAQ